MAENIKARWLVDHEQTKIAPKTLSTQIMKLLFLKLMKKLWYIAIIVTFTLPQKKKKAMQLKNMLKVFTTN